jgi:hypothetical protein
MTVQISKLTKIMSQQVNFVPDPRSFWRTLIFSLNMSRRVLCTVHVIEDSCSYIFQGLPLKLYKRTPTHARYLNKGSIPHPLDRCQESSSSAAAAAATKL